MHNLIIQLLVSILFFFSINVSAEKLAGGEIVGRHIYGLAIDHDGDPLLIEDKPLIYEKSEFDITLDVGESRFLVSGFNHQIAGVYITRLNTENNHSLDTESLKTSNVGGLNSLVSGYKTPWNSVIMLEGEYIDAGNSKEFIRNFTPFFKGKADNVNPYRYGWVSEVVILTSGGESKVIKNYAMGRIFAKQMVIMPDNRTVYLLDGEGNLYVFISSYPQDFMQGTLYSVNEKKGQLQYSLLGETSAFNVKYKLEKMWPNTGYRTEVPVNHHCSKQFTYTNTVFGEECLQVPDEFSEYIGFFEPIRTLALKKLSPLMSLNSQMKFDVKNKRMLFTLTEKDDESYPVISDSTMKSDYLLRKSK